MSHSILNGEIDIGGGRYGEVGTVLARVCSIRRYDLLLRKYIRTQYYVLACW